MLFRLIDRKYIFEIFVYTISLGAFFYTQKDKDIDAGDGVKLTNCKFATF